MALVIGIVTGALSLGPAAFADGTDADVTARAYVEQAIGLIRGQPELSGLIADRIQDALEDDESEDVDLALVEQANQAFVQGRDADALRLLQRSIGIPQVAASTIDREWKAEPRLGGGSADGLLVGAVLLLISGFVLVRRSR